MSHTVRTLITSSWRVPSGYPRSLTVYMFISIIHSRSAILISLIRFNMVVPLTGTDRFESACSDRTLGIFLSPSREESPGCLVI